jgi:hypothetical protein
MSKASDPKTATAGKEARAKWIEDLARDPRFREAVEDRGCAYIILGYPDPRKWTPKPRKNR